MSGPIKIGGREHPRWIRLGDSRPRLERLARLWGPAYGVGTMSLATAALVVVVRSGDSLAAIPPANLRTLIDAFAQVEGVYDGDEVST